MASWRRSVSCGCRAHRAKKKGAKSKHLKIDATPTDAVGNEHATARVLPNTPTVSVDININININKIWLNAIKCGG